MKAFPPVAIPLVDLKHTVRLATNPGMAALGFFLLLLVAPTPPAAAQEMPRVQVFGGYSYTRFDSPSFGFSNASGLNGYNFSPAVNIIRGFGVAAELSGQYGSNLNLRDIAVGPQFVFPKGKKLFFAHLLFGEARSLVQVGAGEEDTERAWAVGGGMDFNILSHFDVRVFQVDYLHTALFQTTQNNVRFSIGLVYRWGEIKQKGHKTPAKSP